MTRDQAETFLVDLALNAPNKAKPDVAAAVAVFSAASGAKRADIEEYLGFYDTWHLLEHDAGNPDALLSPEEQDEIPSHAWRDVATSRAEAEKDDYLARILNAPALRQVA